MELLELIQEFIDTNPNEAVNLAESEILVSALAEVLRKSETPRILQLKPGRTLSVRGARRPRAAVRTS